MMKKLLFIFLLLSGCSPEKVTEANIEWFDLPMLGKELVATMHSRNSEVRKKVIINGKIEEQEINSADSLFWATELDLFVKTDFNSPQLKGQIMANEGIQDSLSNLLIDEYRIGEDAHSAIQVIRIYYLNTIDNIRKLELEQGTDNIISSTSSDLTVWMNHYGESLVVDSVKSIGLDKMILQPPRSYEIRTSRIP